MAEIFLAIRGGLKGFSKLLVIKRILPQLATNKSFGQMLLDEARIAATLTHPNIVQIYDVGSVGGDFFIAMEYLPGENVRTVARALRQRGEWFTLGEAVTIVMSAADGLDYAHNKEFGGKALQIVHRDVSPKNVVVSYHGAVKVLDFGIAKASNKISEETRAGLLKGSLPYMSPEQARGQQLDRRSDIFSLGIMLYELTTRKRLFKQQSDFDVLQKIVSADVVKPSEVWPEYPPELERIVMKALAREPGDRYQTSRELHDDLEEMARSQAWPISARPLKQLMERLFPDRIEALKEAERLGQDFASALPELLPDSDSESEVVGSHTSASHTGLPQGGRRWVELGIAAAVSAALAIGAVLFVATRREGSRTAGASVQRADSGAAGAAGGADGASPVPSSVALPGAPGGTGGDAGSTPSAETRPAGTGPQAAAAADGGAAPAGPSAKDPVAPAAPQKVVLDLDSTPRGAKVYIADELKGETPIKVTLDSSDKSVTLRLKLSGYRDYTKDWKPNRDATIAAALSSLPARRTRKPRNDDELSDPWK
jgi:serine/threonine-protein kinase